MLPLVGGFGEGVGKSGGGRKGGGREVSVVKGGGMLTAQPPSKVHVPKRGSSCLLPRVAALAEGVVVVAGKAAGVQT